MKNSAEEFFYQMLRIRRIEEKIAELYPEGEMRCPIHLCIGQEATAVGACAALAREDYVMSNHRSHGHYLAKGGDLKAMMAELYGKATGCSRGRGGSMHLVDLSVGYLGSAPIVASTIAIAVGAAFGSVMHGEKRVTMAFFGEAATEEGTFHEAINFASLKKLPVVFLCENNFYSVYSPLSVRQPEGREVFRLAEGHGVESFQGDGNNVEEVFQLTEKAVKKARQGRGPTFLEFKTYRWREHCGPNYDNHIGYRTEEEFQKWKRLCPIETSKKILLKKGVLNQSTLDGMEQQLKSEIDEAVTFAKKSPFPEEGVLSEEIYAS